MSSRRFLSLIVGLGLSSCAAPTTPFVVDAAHPASPDAPTAPMPEPLATLAIGEPISPAATGTTTPQHEMGHMRHSDSAPGTSQSQPTPRATPTIYTCPMHPEVISPAPGRCPKCGMTLVPRTPPEHGEQHE